MSCRWCISDPHWNKHIHWGSYHQQFLIMDTWTPTVVFQTNYRHTDGTVSWGDAVITLSQNRRISGQWCQRAPSHVRQMTVCMMLTVSHDCFGFELPVKCGETEEAEVFFLVWLVSSTESRHCCGTRTHTCGNIWACKVIILVHQRGGLCHQFRCLQRAALAWALFSRHAMP